MLIKSKLKQDSLNEKWYKLWFLCKKRFLACKRHVKKLSETTTLKQTSQNCKVPRQVDKQTNLYSKATMQVS